MKSASELRTELNLASRAVESAVRNGYPLFRALNDPILPGTYSGHRAPKSLTCYIGTYAHDMANAGKKDFRAVEMEAKRLLSNWQTRQQVGR